MDRESLIRFLNGPGLIPPHLTGEIAAQFSPKSLRKGDTFLKAGRVCNEYLFLSEGFMRAYAVDPDGAEVTTAFYAAGSIVFEVASFFNRSSSNEQIQAITDCSGWCLSYGQLNDLFHALPGFREFGRHILVKGYAALKARMLATITETADQRYEQLMNDAPEILQHAPLKHVASYLGITDTSLSRIRKTLAEKSRRY